MLDGDEFDEVFAGDVAAIGELVSAAEAVGADGGAALVGLFGGGEEALVSDGHGDVVVFIAEGAGHTAATGVDLGDFESGDAFEECVESGGCGGGFLVAVAVDEDFFGGCFEFDVDFAGFDAVGEEVVEHEAVGFDALAELFVVDEVGQVVEDGGGAAGFGEEDGEALVGEGEEVSECGFAVTFGVADHAFAESGSLAAAGVGEGDVVAAGFEEFDGAEADVGLVVVHVGVVEEDDTGSVGGGFIFVRVA